MDVYKVLAGYMLVVFVLNACEAPPTPMSSQTAIIPGMGDTTIGMVNTIQTRVLAGPIGNLNNVTVSQDLYSNDAVSVTDGGVALLNFLDQIAIKLFNDTSLGGVNVEVLESTNRRLHMKLERGGLSGQVVKDSGGADFEIANGVHIYIAGTSFYITYDPTTDIVSAGNFDGIVGYHVPGQPPQLLPIGSLVDILPGGTVQLFDLPFDIKAFDLAAQTDNSPIQGLKNLRGLSTQSTPATVGTITPSSTLAAGAVIHVPSISVAANTPPPATCSYPAGWVTYTVQSGETLYQIGLKFGVTTTALQNGNCMARSLLIYTGQVLYVPNIAPTILSVVLTPDTPPPGITLIPTDIPTIEPTHTFPAPISTPTPTDTPTYFQGGTASTDHCAVSFSVAVSDADGIGTVKVIYSINGVTSFLAVMSQSQGAYEFSTILKQNTSPSDTITYYFKAIDLLGHFTESGKAIIQAGDCQVGMGVQ